MSPAASSSTPPLRVLQVITRLGLGGAERVALAIVRELRAEMAFAVFTVHGMGPDEIGGAMRDELAAAGVPWFPGTRVPMKRGGMVPGGLALARAVARFRPDVIHYHSETPESCGAVMMVLSSAGRRIPVVRTIHNSIFWRFWPRIGRWCDRRLAPDHIACVSVAARDEFRRYRQDSGAAAPAAEPVIIYNGVALPARPPREAPGNPQRLRLLFAGRFEDQKGTDILCAALPRVELADGVQGELVCVGHGAHETRLRALAANPPRHWQVQVRPPVSDLAALLPDFDLVVMPSRFEGLGLVAVEAVLCGVPLVATAVPGLQEALPADYPWRARPEDPADLAAQISRALRSSAPWRSATASAQDFVRARFDPAAMGAAYRRLYAAAAGRPA